VPTVRALRQKLNLTQEEFAKRFHLPLGTVRDWEQGAHRPDKAAQVLLTVIAKTRMPWRALSKASPHRIMAQMEQRPWLERRRAASAGAIHSAAAKQ
jgi:transcriptional regulator with XRE-family HTH domain